MRGQGIPRTSKVIFGTLFMSGSVCMLKEKVGKASLQVFFFNRIVFPHFAEFLPVRQLCSPLSLAAADSVSSLWVFGQPEK